MNRIREIRKSKGISQQKLAEVLHVNQTAISQWETGKTSPNIDSAKAMADLFDVSMEYLLSDDAAEEKNKKPAAESHELSELERELIRLLEQVPEERKAQVLAYIEASLRLQGAL